MQQDDDVGMVDHPPGFVHANFWWTVSKPGHAFNDAAEIKDSTLDCTRWFEAISDTGEQRPFLYIKKDECFVPVPDRFIDPQKRPLVQAALLPPDQTSLSTKILPGAVGTDISLIRDARAKERISKRVHLGLMPTQKLSDIPKSGRHSQALLFRQFLASMTMAAVQSGQAKPATSTEWVRTPRLVEAKHPEYLKGMVDAFALLVGHDVVRMMSDPELPNACTKDASIVAGVKQMASMYPK